MTQRFALVNHTLGMQNLGHAAETDNPTEEHGGNSHVDGEDEMIFPVGNQHRILTETVDDDIEQYLVKTQFHIHRITGDGAKKDLIAPLWSADKKAGLRYLQEYLAI